MDIPVDVVEEGELTFIADHDERRNAGPGDNDGPYKGGSLIKNIDLPFVGCLGVNTDYGGSYRLLSAAHVLTNFDRDNIGKEIEVKNAQGKFVPIGATVTDQVDVVLYDSPKEPKPKYAKQDLAWAVITCEKGSPEIKCMSLRKPRNIRKINPGERVKFYGGYSNVLKENVEVECTLAMVKMKVATPSGAAKYAYFEDVCRIVRPKSFLSGKEDSGTAIVAQNDDALVGMLFSFSETSKACFFFKLEPEHQW